MADPYVYPGTDILKNKWNVQNQDVLDQLEAEFVSLRIKEEMQSPVSGDFDFDHLCRLHRYFFQDVFEWAGQPRIIDIEKAEPALGGISIEYEDHELIEKAAIQVLQEMNRKNWSDLSIKQQAKELSQSMAALWRVHCFREGNTRTTVTFCCHFAESRGIPLEPALFAQHSAYVRTALVAASAVFTDLGDRSNPVYLERIVLDSLEKGLRRERENAKTPEPQPRLLEKLAEAEEKCSQQIAPTHKRNHEAER